MSDSDSDFGASDSGSDFAAEATPKSPKNKKVAPKPKKPAAEKAAPKAKKANKENDANKSATADDIQAVFESIDERPKDGKKMSIEKIYQKKTQLEHILLRPDTYIGSVEEHQTQMWVYDTDDSDEGGRMVQRDISYVPGLYKIFDEILVNAADNKQRDAGMNTIKVTIDAEKNEISVWNNGKGIPVVEHKEYQVFVPELIFGTLLTSSNYNDDQHKVTGGRNGYGAKLCNIFSTKFTVETSSKEFKKAFKQTWTNNMAKPKNPPKIVPSDKDDFTKITFTPDLAKFKMENLDKDIIALMQRRAYDVAGSTRGVRVFLNGKRLPVTGFKAYVEQYTRDKVTDSGEPLKVVYETVNPRWEIAIAVSDKGFQHVSFVNSIATTKGGRHVDYVADAIVAKLIEKVRKDLKKGNMQIKPFQIKTHMWIFVNALIVNPTFDSQTKENMTLQAKAFGSKCEPSEKFYGLAVKCGITDAVLNWVKFKQQEQMEKKSGKKTTKLKGVPKLEDANDAGTKNSPSCTLILTEGDSAKTLAVSGLSVVGRDTFGIFPLKGKCLNTREASHKQIMENAEINNIIKILGLSYKKKYSTDEDLKSLRYGKLMVMADQDQDGSHIKGLIVNFIHHSWPSLLQRNFIEEFITPIVKATKGKDEEISFFSVPEYLNWKKETPNWHTYRIKYYKGLGTSTAKEAKEYFSDMRKHRIPFKYQGKEDDDAIELAFSKKFIEERKDWLTKWMTDRRTRRAAGVEEDHLYQADTRSVTYADFVNKELVLFSNMDNERSIPSLVDGFKPGQRKVLFTCFKRNDKKEVKVAQLAGSVAEMSEYHHGEASLMGTIVNLAQNFVGSNNVNTLLPIGQFGTRLQGGKDSASPRYIFTKLSPVTRTIFPVDDDNVLRYLFEDNRKIEPEWYCPILPMVLVNGASGIGTGWSTSVPNYNPKDIVANLRRLIDGEEARNMVPWYKGFKGEIQDLDGSRFVCHGDLGVIDDTNLEIVELPVKTWTEAYKTGVLDAMLGGEKTPATITEYRDNTTDCTVKFKVKLTPEMMRKADHAGMHKHFKLQSVINTSSMVLFDGDGVLRRYESVKEIMADFFTVRKLKYIDRKNFLEGMLKAQSSRLSNQARFILEKISGKILMENKKKKSIVEQLVKGGYDADPVKAWREEVKRRELAAGGDVAEEEGEEANTDDEAPAQEDAATESRLSSFDYLVTMSLIKLSEEEKDKLLRERDTKLAELKTLQAKDWKDLWIADLDLFEKTLQEYEEKEAKEMREAGQKLAQKESRAKGAKGRKAAAPKTLAETLPTPSAVRVVPQIDAATKAKYEKIEAAKARPKGEKKVKKTKEEQVADDLEDDSLFNRVAKKSPKGAALLKTGPKKGAMDKFLSAKKKLNVDDEDEEGTSKKPAAKRKAESPQKVKKKSRKKSWSGSDSEEDSDEEPSDGGISDSENEVMTVDSDSDAIVEKPKKAPAKKPVEKKETTIADSDSDAVVEEPKKAPAKKPAEKKAVIEEDSDSDAIIEETKQAAKKPVEKKKVATIADSDSDAIVEEPKKVAKKPAEKKKVATIADSDSEDDEAPKKAAKKPAEKKKVEKKETKKRAAISDSDESAEEKDEEESGPSQSGSASSPAPAPRAARRAAAANVKYDQLDETEDADEEEEDSDFADSDD